MKFNLNRNLIRRPKHAGHISIHAIKLSHLNKHERGGLLEEGRDSLDRNGASSSRGAGDLFVRECYEVRVLWRAYLCGKM